MKTAIEILDELEDILETKCFTTNNMFGNDDDLIRASIVLDEIEKLREENENK
jgi:hypothetical protein